MFFIITEIYQKPCKDNYAILNDSSWKRKPILRSSGHAFLYYQITRWITQANMWKKKKPLKKFKYENIFKTNIGGGEKPVKASN